MIEILSEKATLRRALLSIRSRIATDVRRQWDAAIGRQITSWWKEHPVQSLGVYWPIRNEPDLREIYADLASCGVQLALPIVIDADAPLQFAAWQPGDALMKDAMGVFIPASTATLIQPQALLIPCVGFNAARMRLGYGGGFYDRTLAALPRPFAIGIGYACGLTEFQGAPHDIALDMIVTEMSCIADG